MSRTPEDRFREIERRLERIEARLGLAPAPSRDDVSGAQSPPAARAPESALRRSEMLSVTGVLGWGGAVALVLAAVYLIRLAVDSGWLTPTRQVSLAGLGGIVLIVFGLGLRKGNRKYASLLPAAGIVVLFLSIYGAQVTYGLVDGPAALGLVAAVSLAALALATVFQTDAYALFAVGGSYAAPLVLDSTGGMLAGAIVYFSFWSLVFSTFAVWTVKRRVYLVAVHLALITFDMVWRAMEPDLWLTAALFHAAQFVVFGSAATVFSIRHRQPMSAAIALGHVPPLVIFYGLEYSLVSGHVPEAAPLVAGLSAAAVVGFYAVARRALHMSLDGAQLLIGTFTAVVLVHAGFIESIPERLQPWAAATLGPGLAFALWRWASRPLAVPIQIAAGLVYALYLVGSILGVGRSMVPAFGLLAVVFAVELYAGYGLARRLSAHREVRIAVIVAGHGAAMASAVHVFDGRFAVSIVWALLALGSLVIALRTRDVYLGNSSLLVYAVSAAKVFLFDIAGAGPLVRIGCLVALGISLYAGGLLYQRVNVASYLNDSSSDVATSV